MKTKPIIYIFCALVFSALFVTFPWEHVTGVQFVDTESYLTRIDLLLTDRDGNLDGMKILELIVREPIWRLMLIFFGNSFVNPLDGIHLVSFLSILTYILFLYGRVNMFLTFFFFLNPMVVGLVMSQTRSAFAMALCLIAFMLNRPLFKWLRWVIVLAAMLIHSATFVIVAVFFFSKFCEINQKRFNLKTLIFSTLVFGLALALMLSVWREYFLGALGDRRVVYDAGVGSFKYLAFWSILAAIFLFSKPQNGLIKPWFDYYSAAMLILPLIMRIFVTNGVRFIALCFPLFLCAIFSRRANVRRFLLYGLFVHQLVQYLYWLRIV